MFYAQTDPTTNESSECCLTFSHQQKFLYVVIEKFIFITLLPVLEMDIDNISAAMDNYINCMLYEETDGAVE